MLDVASKIDLTLDGLIAALGLEHAGLLPDDISLLLVEKRG